MSDRSSVETDPPSTDVDPSEPATESEDQRKARLAHIADIVTVFVLSIMAVLTAWCGFEASKWGGEMSIAFSQASSARIQAGVADGTARDARQYDLTLYTQFVLAERDDRSELADYIRARFTPEFSKAFDAVLDRHVTTELDAVDPLDAARTRPRHRPHRVDLHGDLPDQDLASGAFAAI